MLLKRARFRLTPALPAAAVVVFLVVVFALYRGLVSEETGRSQASYALDPKVEVELRRLCSRLGDETSFLCRSVSDEHGDLPYIFAITPTYARHVQKAELTRLCHTFLHVPRFHWIVVEDSREKTNLVTIFLKNCGVPYAHLNVPTLEKFKTPEAMNARLKPPRGVQQRNLGLAYLHERFKDQVTAPPGVVYFADDDNTYDLRLFDEMRSIKGVGVAGRPRRRTPGGEAACWPGRAHQGLEHAVGTRTPVPNMAGFAVNLKLILQHPELAFRDDARVGYLESIVLETLEIPYWDVEVYVWHTRTEEPKLKMEPKLDEPSNAGIEI